MPPVTVATASPAANNAGWNKADVTVTLSATDNTVNNVKEIHVALAGAQNTGDVVYPGATALVVLSSEGTTSLTYFAVDKFGNRETPRMVGFKIDKTPPTIAGSREPGANPNGWNNNNVAVSFVCSDTPSGVASCVGNTTVTTEGANQSVTGTATDQADNTASVSVGNINIDKTAPTITGMPAGATCSLWPPNHKMVTVATVGAADVLSGLGSFNVTATSNEPDNGLGDGDTPGDIAITGTNPKTVALRAERSGTGTGRIYSILAVVSDVAGNATRTTSTCTVPRSQGK